MPVYLNDDNLLDYVKFKDAHGSYHIDINSAGKEKEMFSRFLELYPLNTYFILLGGI